MSRRRLDVELVRRGLAESRVAAQTLIDAGRVTVGGAPANKASRLVDGGDAVVVAGEPDRYVGRGGHKLEAALTGYGIDVTGRRFLDAGASTGGFTDCLLQHGAAAVVAVDVGHGQLHERLRRDPRIEVRERTNVRDLRVDDLGEAVDGIVADLSFISLTKVIDAFVAVSRPGAVWVLLVKPQFEAGRAEVSRGKGVVTDPAVWRSVLEHVIGALDRAGSVIMGVMVSPLRGADGNVEFLLAARAPDASADRSTVAPDLDALISGIDPIRPDAGPETRRQAVPESPPQAVPESQPQAGPETGPP